MCTITNSDDVKITQKAFTQEFNLSALPPDLIFFFFSGSSSTGMVGIPIISVVHPVGKKTKMERRWCHSGPENGTDGFDCNAEFRWQKVVLRRCETTSPAWAARRAWEPGIVARGHRHKAQWRAFTAPRGQEWTVTSPNAELVNDIRLCRGNNERGVVNEERKWAVIFAVCDTRVCAPSIGQ